MIQTSAPLERIAALPGEVAADWLIVPVSEDSSSSLGELEARLRETGDLTGKLLELVPVLTPVGVAARRVLFVGMGKRETATRSTFSDIAAAGARFVTGRAHDHVAFALPEGLSPSQSESAILGVQAGLIQGSVGPGLRKSESARHVPKTLTVIFPPSMGSPAELEKVWKRGGVEARAIRLARELVNLPPNELYPETFAQRICDNAAEYNLECTVWDEQKLKAERMNAILGVARGSERPPRLVVLRSMRGPAGKVLALVGKGVTFDSGGLSLKTNDQMIDMKCDMAGAAAVFSAMVAVAELRLPINLIAILPLVENMPGGRAFKLGDVITTRSGKTIEILNTDAEGRVILADALHHAVELKATHLVDLATLTGACMVALGSEVAGLMSNHDEWAETIQRVAKAAGEKVWRLPMDAHYGEQIKSAIADMKNAPGTRYGGAITAAKFLEQFVGETPWTHLDIAGPAWAERDGVTRDSGGTGFGVRTLIELAHQFENNRG